MEFDKNSHRVSVESSLAKWIPGMLLPCSPLHSKQESACQKWSKPMRLRSDTSGRQAHTLLPHLTCLLLYLMCIESEGERMGQEENRRRGKTNPLRNRKPRHLCVCTAAWQAWVVRAHVRCEIHPRPVVLNEEPCWCLKDCMFSACFCLQNWLSSATYLLLKNEWEGVGGLYKERV